MSKFTLGGFFGDKELDGMLNRVDTLVDKLNSNKKALSQKTSDPSEAVREFIGTLEDKDSSEDNVQQLLQNLTIPAQRANRYRIYDEIYSSVQIIKSIIRVYINNILQKDIITGGSIVYTESSEFKLDTEQVKKYKKVCEAVIKKFKIEHRLNNKILQHLLRYGDHYIEVIDLKEDTTHLPSIQSSPTSTQPASPLSRKSPRLISEEKIIEENLSYIDRRLKQSNNGDEKLKQDDIIDKFIECVVEINDTVDKNDVDVNTEYVLYENYINEQNKDDKNLKIDNFQKEDLKRILLRFHSPKNIVVLTTEYNNTTIGYVEVKHNKKIEVTPGVGMQFASVIKQISAISKSKIEDHSAVVRKIVHRIIGKIIQKADIKRQNSFGQASKELDKKYEEELYNKLGDDLFYLIKKLYIESDPKKSENLTKVQVRFISDARMVQLSNNPIEYAPYGTSIIDPLIYPAKLYLLTQLTNIVTKLSRAALIRKWTIETGPREQHTNLMQKLKRELRNQRITVDDIVSFKSIPKIMSDFKDMILLTKKGVRFVDVDVQSFGDANIKIADLEDTRRELISLSGVPAPLSLAA